MPTPPEDDDTFFNRWSKRKRAQRVQVEPEPEDQDVPIVAPDPQAEDESLSPEELAGLPSLDDLTPETDIQAFLQKGVPKALRNAALRRKWMLVPGIRDHNDPAVDYAWDWNTPGGVPGDGLAPSPERAAQMLRELIAPRREAASAETVETGPDLDNASPEDVAAQNAEGTGDQPQPEAVADSVRLGTASVTPQPDVPETDEVPPVGRKRHGGALPG